MKTKLTKDDPSGWFLCEQRGCEFVLYWDGHDAKSSPTGLRAMEAYTNFRRLIEVCEPEVIEGDGVTPLPKGTYWIEHHDSLLFVLWRNGETRGERGSRYIRIPEPQFPPREEPDPPKPELVLVRTEDQKRWCIAKGPLWVATDGSIWRACDCKVVEAKGATA